MMSCLLFLRFLSVESDDFEVFGAKSNNQDRCLKGFPFFCSIYNTVCPVYILYQLNL